MSHSYGTRSSTKRARSGCSVTTNPPTPKLPAASVDVPQATADLQLRSNGKGQPSSAAACAQLSRTDHGRKPLVPPLPAKNPAPGYTPRPFAPAAAPPVAAAASIIGTENRPPSGGSSIGGDRRRKRSRLSLVGKRRASPVLQQQGVVGSGSPMDAQTSCASQQQRHSALVDGKGGSNAVVGCFPGGVSPRLTDGSLDEAEEFASSGRNPAFKSEPLPPFVGLKNLGETCYVNSVLQALTACCRVLVSSREASGAGSCEKNASAGRDGEGVSVPSSVAPSETGDVVDRALAGGMAATRGRVGTDGNPVPRALGEVLRRMEQRNRELFQQGSAASVPQIAARSPSEFQLRAPVSSRISDPAMAVESDNDASAIRTPEASHPRNETPLRPGDSAKEDPNLDPFAPSALVELIREGWLNHERAAGEAAVSVGSRFGLGLGGPAGSTDFGTGQACVSEFLGKLLRLGASCAAVAGGIEPGGTSGDDDSPGGVSAGDTADDVCGGLAGSFRGTLCSRTLCVECERDRTTREDFVELMLPPLVLPRWRPPSSPGPTTVLTTGTAAAAAATGGGENHSKTHEERRTLQSLVDGMLGRESLEGSNKVWCDACHQWTEAERRSSLHSLPDLLALHVRPGIGKQSSLRPFPTFALASNGAPEKQGGATADEKSGRGSASKAEGGAAVGNDTEEYDDGDGPELIERVLVVNEATRCQFHHQEEAAPSGGAGGVSAEPRPRDSGDALYDLVGAILHHGQTLGSGHYTFALHVENDVSADPSRHRPPPAAGNTDIARGAREGSARSSSQGREDGRNLECTKKGMTGVGGYGRVGAAAVPASSTACGKSASLALFDDDVVRWLTPKEARVVLRGGGPGLGEPFLVFYARRRTRGD